MGNSIFAPVGAVENPRNVANSDIYKVGYKDGKNNIYQATIRFIPWVKNPARCIVDKQVSWVKNPANGKGMYIDDPRSVGEFSPVANMFFRFYNTKSDQFIDFAKKNLSSKLQYASLVQIIRDDQHPELQGQIKVFIYGKTIWQMLYEEEHPTDGVSTPTNPFHPIDGRYFFIKCCEKSGFNNFDQCKFLPRENGATSAMYLPGVDGMMHPIDANTDQNLVVEYLQTNSPDLSKYEYQPWTEEQAKFVDEVLQISDNYLQTGTIPTNMATLNGVNMQPVAQPQFPGVSMPVNQGMMTPPPAAQGMPQMPQMPGMSQMPAPTQPDQMPQMPAPTMTSPRQANNSFGGFTIGSVPNTNAPANQGQPMTQSGINGMVMPPVMNSQPQQQAAQPGGSIGGNIDDILNSI